MTLHVPTLCVVAVFVTTILSALLLFCWWRDRSTPALLWWSAAYFANMLALALLSARGHIPIVLSIDIANATMIVGYSFMLAGVRSFSKRDTPPTAFLVCPLIFLIARQLTLFEDINARVMLISSLLASLTALAAFELWRARDEALLSRWPAILVFVVHATTLCIRIPVVIINPMESDLAIRESGNFALMTFGTLLYAITLAFILLAMTKERGELRHKTAALIDPLTGLPNRRAFLECGMACRPRDDAPLSVLLADLDRFKTVNDRFGHPVGDRVLQLFAATVERMLRPVDLSGRLGGEEFAVLLPGASAADAERVAERIRAAYSIAAETVGGHAVASTVSIGVATTSDPECGLTHLLAVADRALYRSKAEGRDRVVAIDCDAALDLGAQTPPLVPGPARPLALALAC